MRSNEIIRQIRARPQDGNEFIKWWRIENDFVDYELVESFIQGAGSNHEFAGYELLSLEEMWQTLERYKPGKLRRANIRGKEVIEWLTTDKQGQEHTYTCPFTPRSVMSIFDAETDGDVID